MVVVLKVATNICNVFFKFSGETTYVVGLIVFIVLETSYEMDRDLARVNSAGFHV